MSPHDFARQHRMNKVIKAVKQNSGMPKIRSQPKPASSGSSGGSAGGQPQGGFPIGTIRNGRQKIKSNPSVWVDVSSGKSYESHDTEEHKHHQAEGHDQLSEIKSKTMDKLKSQLPDDKIGKAETLLSEFLQKRMHAKNMMSAGNVESTKLGTVPKDHQKTYYKLSDEAEKAKQQFVKYVNDAKKGKDDGKKG